MTRGGPRPGSGRKPLDAADRRMAHPVYLTAAEYDATLGALEPHETWQDFMREAAAKLVEARDAAIREARRRKT